MLYYLYDQAIAQFFVRVRGDGERAPPPKEQALIASARWFKRPHEIEEQIIGILEAYREPQQVVGTGRAGSFDGGTVLDQAFHVAERGRALPDLDARGSRDRGGFTSLEPDGQTIVSWFGFRITAA